MEKTRNNFPDPATRWLDVHEAARYLGLSVAWVYQLTMRRAIPFYRIGRQCRFSLEELTQWVLIRKVKTQNELQRDAEQMARR